MRVADAVSVDGAGPISHSRFWGRRDLFDRLRCSVEMLMAAGNLIASGRTRAAFCTIDNHLS
jgi:hypothetical protein